MSWLDQEVPIHLPSHLDWTGLYFRWIACWCKPRWYKDYKMAIGKANADVGKQLDITQILRRLRMHGYAITTNMTAIQRTTA